jgi:hypothetical protein
MPPGVPFATPCSAAPPTLGDAVIVGVNEAFAVTQGADTLNEWVPLFGGEQVEWVAKMTASDFDHDGVCDAVDNCVGVPNADQRNDNATAENAWGGDTSGTLGGHGVNAGNACDTAPVPAPSLGTSNFAPSGASRVLTWAGSGTPAYAPGVLIESYGREIDNRIVINPILADGTKDPSSNVTYRFCMCRHSDGAPITTPSTCVAAPFFCNLRPTEASLPETGGFVAHPGAFTYWHAMTVTTVGACTPLFPGGPCVGGGASTAKGQTYPISYPGTAPFLSPTWDYATDYASWLTSGWTATLPPLPSSPNYQTGTDVGGALWAHSNDTAGAYDHNVGIDVADCSTSPCTIVDGYAFGKAPDMRSAEVIDPIINPAGPLGSFGLNLPVALSACVECGDAFQLPGQASLDPAPFVTVDPASLDAVVWLKQGGRSTSALSQGLLQTVINPSVVWVSASEPVSMTNEASSPRALLLASNATNVLDGLYLSTNGFELMSEAGLPINPTGIDPPTARAGFGAAWSRTANALYVIGGKDLITSAVNADAWRYTLAAGWTSAPVDPAHAPGNVLSAAFSPSDWRVWMLDRRDTGETRLLRIDADTGLVSTDVSMRCLDSFDALWLVTLAEGGVVLVGQQGLVYRLALLSALPFTANAPLQILGAAEGLGNVVAPPAVRFGSLTLGVEKLAGWAGRVIAPVTYTAAQLKDTWPGLDHCDQPCGPSHGNPGP